jgi:lysophospholipase L1-like esterase
MLRWDEHTLATYMQRRNPALIMLAYGTNEASNPNWDQGSYQAMFSQLLQRLRNAAPAASIVVLGPVDRWSRSKGAWRPVPGVDGIIAAQRAASAENRCAFWDMRQRMGDKGSMRDWVYAGLAQGDYVHLTSAGYQRMGEVLFQDLMRLFETYKKSRSVVTDQDKHGQAH